MDNQKVKILSFANQKGGVGKSTTAITTAAGLVRKGYKVLLIDADPQGNSTFASGGTFNINNNLFFVMKGNITAAEAIQSTAAGFDLIPSVDLLATADQTIDGAGREYVIREAIKPLRARYDFILVDCPPSLGALTVNALTASQGVIIPAGTDIFAYHGILQLKRTIDTLQQYSNKDLKLLGILLTQYNTRAKMARDLRHQMKDIAEEKLHTQIYETLIRSCRGTSGQTKTGRPYKPRLKNTGRRQRPI